MTDYMKEVMMKHAHIRTGHFSLAVTAAAALLLAGCGGGGGIDTTNAPPGDGLISGSVVKGPVSGATVQAFALNGGVMGAAACQRTD